MRHAAIARRRAIRLVPRSGASQYWLPWQSPVDSVRPMAFIASGRVLLRTIVPVGAVKHSYGHVLGDPAVEAAGVDTDALGVRPWVVEALDAAYGAEKMPCDSGIEAILGERGIGRFKGELPGTTLSEVVLADSLAPQRLPYLILGHDDVQEPFHSAHGARTLQDAAWRRHADRKTHPSAVAPSLQLPLHSPRVGCRAPLARDQRLPRPSLIVKAFHGKLYPITMIPPNIRRSSTLDSADHTKSP
jgi:hypothetical protein